MRCPTTPGSHFGFSRKWRRRSLSGQSMNSAGRQWGSLPVISSEGSLSIPNCVWTIYSLLCGAFLSLLSPHLLAHSTFLLLPHLHSCRLNIHLRQSSIVSITSTSRWRPLLSTLRYYAETQVNGPNSATNCQEESQDSRSPHNKGQYAQLVDEAAG